MPEARGRALRRSARRLRRAVAGRGRIWGCVRVALRAMTAGRTTVLVTLTGRDRPGVTSRLFSDLAAHDLAVADIEQVVIRGRLVLGVLLACEGHPHLPPLHPSFRTLAPYLDPH